MNYSKAIHIRKNKDNGKIYIFISNYVSNIDVPYKNYFLI